MEERFKLECFGDGMQSEADLHPESVWQQAPGEILCEADDTLLADELERDSGEKGR